jgi:hypothetical protein
MEEMVTFGTFLDKVFSILRTFPSAPHEVLASFFMMAKRSLALVWALVICVVQVMRRSSVMPRWVLDANVLNGGTTALVWMARCGCLHGG